MYEVMLERSAAAGYEHYEISNLCLPGYQSRHNTKYWTGAPYYGFGCSAHSYDGAFRRWANERDIGRYLKLIEQNNSAVVLETELTQQDRQSESVFLGLRMMDGFSVERYRELFGADIRETHASDLARFRDAGLIELSGDLVKLTRAGALMSNEVFAAFL
jgi:oxygen-independent coproporphyrinogen-3 oxidase